MLVVLLLARFLLRSSFFTEGLTIVFLHNFDIFTTVFVLVLLVVTVIRTAAIFDLLNAERRTNLLAATAQKLVITGTTILIVAILQVEPVPAGNGIGGREKGQLFAIVQ